MLHVLYNLTEDGVPSSFFVENNTSLGQVSF